MSHQAILTWVLWIGSCAHNALYGSLPALLHLPRWFGC